MQELLAVPIGAIVTFPAKVLDIHETVSTQTRAGRTYKYYTMTVGNDQLKFDMRSYLVSLKPNIVKNKTYLFRNVSCP